MYSDKRKELGRKGEEIALSFLKKKGYHILDKNFRCPLGELDIVAREGDQIIFIEVKTRRSSGFGPPEESLNYIKKKRLTRLALFYLTNNRLKGVCCRFDVVAIVFKKEKVEAIHLIKNAFEATF